MSSTITNIPAAATAADSSSATGATSTAAGSNTTLTQQDFLEIMVAQFTQQDPLASGDSSSSDSGTSDYVNELMSMTNLTTMQTMSQQQALSLAGSLPGSTIQLTTTNGSTVSGLVTGTSISNGTLYVTVGGEQYPASDLSAVTQTAAQAAAANNTAPASNPSSSTSSTSSTSPVTSS